jgi:long-chain acyl-CoA synthetase
MSGTVTLAAGIRALPPDQPVTGGRTAGELCVALDALTAAWRPRDLRPGEAVGLPLRNGDDWILAFLALVEAGAQPVLIAPDAPAAERDRVLAQAGGRRWVEPGPLRLAGEPGPAGEPGGVLLVTSGSTGAPKLVRRTEASLLAEADRYVRTLALDGTDHLLLPLPLHHAYALGWLAAALRCGMRVSAVPPTELNAIDELVRGGVTIMALVPTTARLLSMRRLGRRGADPAPALRIVMVGAGPVDAALEASFEQAFGVPTSRNYGSTEMGAVFAGIAPQPPLSVGPPMAGVEFEIVDADGRPCPPGTTGALRVRWEPGMAWHDTQDLARYGDGTLTVLGRAGRAVRRGGQWVSPLEIEAALRRHPEVLDVCVSAQPGRHPGEDVLVADAEVRDPSKVDAAALAAFARTQLAPPSVPQEFWLHDRLARGWSGKIQAPRRYVAADFGALLGAARAYRRSELLFALHDLGILGMLDRPTTVNEVAAELRLPMREVEWLLGVAAALGLVTEPGTADRPASAPIAPMLELESRLSRGWVSRTELVEATREGLAGRPFDRAPDDPALVAAYAAAMHDAAAGQRTALGLRLVRAWPHRHVLEVTAGPGRYLARILAADPEATGCLVQVGRLAGPLDPVVDEAVRHGRVKLTDDPSRGAFDLCVIANAVHGPPPGGDLRWLAERAREPGALLIDDVFLPAEGGDGSEIGLDWLTHGGLAWPHVQQLTAEIEAIGWSVTVNRRIGTAQCHLIVATGATDA